MLLDPLPRPGERIVYRASYWRHGNADEVVTVVGYLPSGGPDRGRLVMRKWNAVLDRPAKPQPDDPKTWFVYVMDGRGNMSGHWPTTWNFRRLGGQIDLFAEAG